jgi:hypothetical protein
VTEYFGSNYSYSTTIADCKHSKDPIQFKLRSLDRAGYPTSMYSHSNDASFFVQQTLVATQRDVRGL